MSNPRATGPHHKRQFSERRRRALEEWSGYLGVDLLDDMGRAYL